MFAFLKTENGYLLKAYEHGDDWQIMVIDPRGVKVCERWCTIWRDENHYPGAKRASLEHAFSRGCDEAKADFTATAVQIAA